MKRTAALLMVFLMIFTAAIRPGTVYADDSGYMSFSGAEMISENDYLIQLQPGETLEIGGNVLFNGEALSSSQYYFMGPLAGKKVDNSYEPVFDGSVDASSIAAMDYSTSTLTAIGDGVVFIPFNSKDGVGGKEQNTYGFDLWIVVSSHTHSFDNGGYCTGCGEFIFSDVTGEKSQQYVSWAYENGIVKGTGENTFAPNNGCSRIQFIMMLWKMHGSKVIEGRNPFSDITGTRTTNAILCALDKGIINSGKSFDPNGEITRAQIVMILYKLAGKEKVTGKNPFSDITGDKLTKAVLWAYNKEITKGTGDGTTFSPAASCTRLQLVIFLYKYNGKYHVI